MYNEPAKVVFADTRQKRNFGIKFASPFNVGSFHVVDGLPPDITHDLREGIVPFGFALVLQHLFQKVIPMFRN